MIQDLLPAAINQATTKAKQMHVEAMKEMTGGIELPGLDDAINQMVGHNNDDDGGATASDTEKKPEPTD